MASRGSRLSWPPARGLCSVRRAERVFTRSGAYGAGSFPFPKPPSTCVAVLGPFPGDYGIPGFRLYLAPATSLEGDRWARGRHWVGRTTAAYHDRITLGAGPPGTTPPFPQKPVTLPKCS